MLQELVDQARREDEILEDETVLKETVSELDGSKLEYKRMQFFHCRFVDCDFSGAEFYHCSWYGCDFSRCRFSESYFKQTLIQGQPGGRRSIHRQRLPSMPVPGQLLLLRQFFRGGAGRVPLFRNAAAAGGAGPGEAEKTRWESADLTGAELFQTPLKGGGFVPL